MKFNLRFAVKNGFGESEQEFDLNQVRKSFNEAIDKVAERKDIKVTNSEILVNNSKQALEIEVEADIDTIDHFLGNLASISTIEKVK